MSKCAGPLIPTASCPANREYNSPAQPIVVIQIIHSLSFRVIPHKANVSHVMASEASFIILEGMDVDTTVPDACNTSNSESHASQTGFESKQEDKQNSAEPSRSDSAMPEDWCK